MFLKKIRNAQSEIQLSQKSSIGNSKEDLLNDNQNKKCSVQSNSELETSKKLKTEISDSKLDNSEVTYNFMFIKLLKKNFFNIFINEK